MIAQLRGQVYQVNLDHLIFDVQGVGYEILASQNTLSDFSFETRSAGQVIYTYTHVREDALQLFGFSTQVEKQMFVTLLKVNGIGPKMAINILSGAKVEQIRQMIESEDVKALSKLPKVGKKTAEQMILTLKGKLAFHSDVLETTTNAVSSHKKDIISALVNLGFRLQDAERVVEKIPAESSLEEGLRLGLSALTT